MGEFSLGKAIGYVFEDPTPLPEWDDFGRFLSNGFVAFIGLLVWMIPLIAFSCCVGIFLADTDSIAANLGFNFAISSVGGVYFALFGPVVIAKYAMERNLAAMFKFDEIFAAIPKVFPGLILVFVVNFVSNIIAPFTLLALCVGILVFAAYVTLVQGHLYGQIARVAFAPTPSTDHPAF